MHTVDEARRVIDTSMNKLRIKGYDLRKRLAVKIVLEGARDVFFEGQFHMKRHKYEENNTEKKDC